AIAGEGRTLRPVRRVVDVSRIERQVRIVHVANAANKELVLARGRIGGRILIGRQQAVFAAGVLVANLLGRRIAGQELCTVVNAGQGTDEAAAADTKIILGLSIVRGPDSPLRIIGESIAGDPELIEIVS